MNTGHAIDAGVAQIGLYAGRIKLARVLVDLCRASELVVFEGALAIGNVATVDWGGGGIAWNTFLNVRVL